MASRGIRLPEELVNAAEIHAKAQHRTLPKQIEFWARMGKIAEENPDLPFSFLQETLIGIEEANIGDTTPYEFDKQ